MRRKVQQAIDQDGVLTIVHGRCVDGLTSAALARRAWPDSRSLHIQHQDLPRTLDVVSSMLEDQQAWLHILVADLAPQERDHEEVVALVERMQDRATVAWLDHHAPQWRLDDETRLRSAAHHLAVDRTGQESGASMTLAFLKGAKSVAFPPASDVSDKETAHFVDVVRGRDTWTHVTEEGIRLMLIARRLHDEDYIRLFGARCFQALLLLSEEPYRRHVRAVQQALQEVEKATPYVAVLYGEHPVSDASAAHFVQDPTTQVLLHVNPRGGLSVRSRAPVAAGIAQALGGGGHMKAAGARLVEGKARTWWLRRRGGRHRRVRQVVELADSLAHLAVR